MNCSFNIRYKPRTTRAFTKSDLTVYDSAGNTALNALTVYGKSEVADGSIVSAGEGWSTVDLGTLNWNISSSGKFWTNTIHAIIKKGSPSYGYDHLLASSKYLPQNTPFLGALDNMKMSVDADGNVQIRDDDYTDSTAFKNSLNGVLLCYELADPTQGNTIAVKTDDGTGIDGTMATFTTGTPLRRIPDTTVRDVMEWDGTSGEVTKNCGEVDLGTLNYNSGIDGTYGRYYTTGLSNIIKQTEGSLNLLCPIFTPTTALTDVVNNPSGYMWLSNAGNISFSKNGYTDVAGFKTAMTGVKLVYELATPTTQTLTSTENTSIAGLRTFAPNTHAQNNAGTDMTVDYTIRVPTI